MNNLWYKNIQLGDIKSVNLDLNQTNILDFNSGDQFIKACTNNQSFIIVNPQSKNFRLILTGGSLSTTPFKTSSKSTVTIRGIESIAYYDANSINIVDVTVLEVRENSITMLISVKPSSVVGDIDIEARQRLTNLENNITIYEIFKSFQTPTITGTVYIPAEAEIFNLYGDGISDAIVVKADSSNNPTEELVLNATGNVVTVSSFIDATGVFTLSSIPTSNYCIVYYIKIADEYKSNVDETKIVSKLEDIEIHSVGVLDIAPPIFTNNNGTITIASSNVGLRSDINHVNNILKYAIPQATLVVPDLVESYLSADYNNGNPIYKIETIKHNVNGSNSTLIYVLWRVGNIVHSSNQDSIGLGLSNKINSRIINTEPYKLSSDGGLVISEVTAPTNRTITCSGAYVYKGVTTEQVFAFNSSTDLFTKVIKTAIGGWTYTSNTVYDNLNYNPDGLGEVALSTSKWSYRLYYRSIGDDKEVFYVLSTNEYNSEVDARNASEIGRDIPIVLSGHCLLIGRSIIKNGSTNGITEAFRRTEGYYVPPTNEYWRDIDFPIIIRTTGAGVPTLTTINGNLAMPTWALNDFNQCESQEFVHEWKEGSTCYFHIHLTTNGLDATDRYVRFEVEYGYVTVNGVWIFPTSINSGDILIPANTPTKTMTIVSIGNFTPTGIKIGGHCVARLKRISSTGTAPTSNCWVPMLQMHIICDTLGSRSIATK